MAGERRDFDHEGELGQGRDKRTSTPTPAPWSRPIRTPRRTSHVPTPITDKLGFINSEAAATYYGTADQSQHEHTRPLRRGAPR